MSVARQFIAWNIKPHRPRPVGYGMTVYYVGSAVLWACAFVFLAKSNRLLPAQSDQSQ
jgi:hypothetical protein